MGLKKQSRLASRIEREMQALTSAPYVVLPARHRGAFLLGARLVLEYHVLPKARLLGNPFQLWTRRHEAFTRGQITMRCHLARCGKGS